MLATSKDLSRENLDFWSEHGFIVTRDSDNRHTNGMQVCRKANARVYSIVTDLGEMPREDHSGPVAVFEYEGDAVRDYDVTSGDFADLGEPVEHEFDSVSNAMCFIQDATMTIGTP